MGTDPCGCIWPRRRGSRRAPSGDAGAHPPTQSDWLRLLDELARQVDDGRVYDRHLDELSVGLAAVLDAVNRTVYIHGRTTRRPH
jgi:hypothetical protein